MRCGPSSEGPIIDSGYNLTTSEQIARRFAVIHKKETPMINFSTASSTASGAKMKTTDDAVKALADAVVSLAGSCAEQGKVIEDLKRKIATLEQKR